MTALSICSAAASIIYLNGYFLTDQTAPREIRSFSGYSLNKQLRRYAEEFC